MYTWSDLHTYANFAYMQNLHTYANRSMCTDLKIVIDSLGNMHVVVEHVVLLMLQNRTSDY